MFDQNGNYVPEWQDFGGEDKQQTPDMGPFAQALKKRFAAKPTIPTGSEHTDIPHGDSGGMGGGGMKSL